MASQPGGWSGVPGQSAPGALVLGHGQAAAAGAPPPQPGPFDGWLGDLQHASPLWLGAPPPPIGAPTADVAFGGLTIAVVGTPVVFGSAAVPLGALTVESWGGIPAGPAVVAFGGLTITATSLGIVKGVATISFGAGGSGGGGTRGWAAIG